MGSTTTSSYSGVVAGQTSGVAAALNAGLTAVNALGSATDTWTCTLGGTGWAVGNGTISTGYTQVGKSVWFNVTFTTGSTTSYGTGSLTLSLPVTPKSTHMAVARYFDTSAGATYGAEALILTNGTAVPIVTPATAGGSSRGITGTVPVTGATGDSITVTGWYEAA